MHTSIRRSLGTVSLVAIVAGAPAVADDGKATYVKACATCHNAIPPKIGDKAAWEPRIKLGLDALVGAVVKGKGAMPPKGGNASLTEGDIRAATEYLIAQSR